MPHEQDFFFSSGRHVSLVSRRTRKQQETAPPAQCGHRCSGVGYCKERNPLPAADNSPGQSVDAALPRQTCKVNLTEREGYASCCVCFLQWQSQSRTPQCRWRTLFISLFVRLSFLAWLTRQCDQVLTGTQHVVLILKCSLNCTALKHSYVLSWNV